MAIKLYKPTTPGRRKSSVNKSDLTKKRPEKNLIFFKKRSGGRNAQGKITVHHRGGGAKRYVRIVDFRRNRYDLPAKVLTFEYDPNRSANIALIQYEDGKKSYILVPQGLEIGNEVISSKGKVPIKTGNRTILENIPVGEMIYNIELSPEAGGKIVRGAGMGATLMGLEGDYAQIKLPSSEIRLVLKTCSASIGVMGNSEYALVRIGLAGRKRHMGIKPTVRGKAKNPVDHPHGGGEGNTPIGLKHPKTPWGKPALGIKTRRKKKASNRLIIQRRKRKRRK
ncbi:MAG: 50S ribosomal protein L2 [Parcubacteria group bacterium CG10_big_fil_rev_8_21_14_0_10_36_14]|nr:MAG: 50S ribosomal protein L2 [Parcubacteria group bacterium CG10_big_fil_rev_8_21_14_0_10_36_14]